MDKLGVIMSWFIVILLGVIFVGIVADNVYDTTNIVTVTNESQNPIVAGTNFTLNHVDLASVPVGYNHTNNSITITVTNNATSTVFARMGGDMNITYTYYPTNYIKGSGPARSIFGLITLFFALGILGIGLYYLSKSGLFELFGKK